MFAALIHILLLTVSAPAAPRVILTNAQGRSFAVSVEIARTSAEHSRGLMFRKQLDSDRGMLFVFKTSDIHSFWMKNTFIPLDLIYIDDNLRIAGIVRDAEPMTTSARGSDWQSRYVLEVNGGFCAEHGIAPGDRLSFEGLSL